MRLKKKLRDDLDRQVADYKLQKEQPVLCFDFQRVERIEYSKV